MSIDVTIDICVCMCDVILYVLLRLDVDCVACGDYMLLSVNTYLYARLQMCVCFVFRIFVLIFEGTHITHRRVHPHRTANIHIDIYICVSIYVPKHTYIYMIYILGLQISFRTSRVVHVPCE